MISAGSATPLTTDLFMILMQKVPRRSVVVGILPARQNSLPKPTTTYCLYKNSFRPLMSHMNNWLKCH